MTIISSFIEDIINLVANQIGQDYQTSKFILMGVVCYILGFFILRKIHKMILKKKLENKKKAIFEYDNILYLISQEEYKIQKTETNSPMKNLFESKKKDYFSNHDSILDAIRRLESETKQIIYLPEMEKKLLKLRKKTARYDAIQKIFGIVLSIGTAGLYLLFW